MAHLESCSLYHPVRLRNWMFLPIQSLRIGRELSAPNPANHWLYMTKLSKLQLSWGKLRREPATRWFDWSFAPIPKFEHRFARQNAFGPPPGFPPASSYSGIVHHLSGPNIHAQSQAFFFFLIAIRMQGAIGEKSDDSAKYFMISPTLQRKISETFYRG